MNNHDRQSATLSILYAKRPIHEGDCFIEIRQWETPLCEASELVVEYGRLDESGELITQCAVMPFYSTVGDILLQINI